MPAVPAMIVGKFTITHNQSGNGPSQLSTWIFILKFSSKMANRIHDESLHGRHLSIRDTMGRLMRSSHQPNESASRAFREELVDLFPKILEAHSDKDVAKWRDLLKQLEKIKKNKHKNKKEIYRVFRSCNSFLQTMQDDWIAMDGIAKMDKEIKSRQMDISKKMALKTFTTDGSPEIKGEETKEMEADLLALKREREKYKDVLLDLLLKSSVRKGDCEPFKTGPVGESPVHICFLLGLNSTVLFVI